MAAWRDEADGFQRHPVKFPFDDFSIFFVDGGQLKIRSVLDYNWLRLQIAFLWTRIHWNRLISKSLFNHLHCSVRGRQATWSIFGCCDCISTLGANGCGVNKTRFDSPFGPFTGVFAESEGTLGWRIWTQKSPKFAVCYLYNVFVKDQLKIQSLLDYCWLLRLIPDMEWAMECCFVDTFIRHLLLPWQSSSSRGLDWRGFWSLPGNCCILSLHVNIGRTWMRIQSIVAFQSLSDCHCSSVLWCIRGNAGGLNFCYKATIDYGFRHKWHIDDSFIDSLKFLQFHLWFLPGCICERLHIPVKFHDWRLR